MGTSWSLAQRTAALAQAERDGLDLLVIGGGITGAGVLRDAASRGLRACLVERDDFAAGTSSRSSKLVHGGLRYLAQGHLGLTREACRERDRLLRQNPDLVRPVPFLFPLYPGGKVGPWQLRAAFLLYDAFSGFSGFARSRMLRPSEAAGYAPALRRAGLVGAGLFHDAQVDDVRLVLETLKSARALGVEAVNYAEVVDLLHASDGRVVGARVRDRIAGTTRTLRAAVVVNATGPWLERVRALDRTPPGLTLRPAKGVHLVLPRRRVPLRCAVGFEAADGRPLFLIPCDDVLLLGTTDRFTDEIDEPVVTIDEVHYLLAAANAAFPRISLTTNDIASVFAGVRPLVAEPGGGERAPSAVSRESDVGEAPSGLLSVAGGKLTTYRAMGEAIGDRVVRKLAPERRRGLGPSRTATLPLRAEPYDRAELATLLRRRHGISGWRATRLIRAWGADAERLIAAAPAALRRPIGDSRFFYAEIPWSFATESPVTLSDLLERRLRLALYATGQGLPELDRVAAVAADAAGWDPVRRRAEREAYAEAVRRRYQIQPGVAAAGGARSAA